MLVVLCAKSRSDDPRNPVETAETCVFSPGLQAQLVTDWALGTNRCSQGLHQNDKPGGVDLAFLAAFSPISPGNVFWGGCK